MKQITRYDGPVMADFKELIGRNMRALRKATGLTGEQFARYLGVSRTHLYMLETGRSLNIRYNALYRLSKETNLDNFFKKSISLGIVTEPLNAEE